MKFCSHCGKELMDEAVFCPGCGCTVDGSAPAQKKSESLSALSIIGFVFAFFESLVGLICSIIAYKTAVKEGDIRSRNFANAGIIVSAVFLALQVLGTIIFIIFFILMFNEPSPYPPGYYY